MPRWDWVAAWIADWRSVAGTASAIETIATWIKGNVPQIVFVVAMVAIVRGRHRLDAAVLTAAVVAVACMPLFWAAAHVQQNTHFLSLWICSVCLGAIVWSRHSVRFNTRALAGSLFVVLTVACLAAPARALGEVV